VISSKSIQREFFDRALKYMQSCDPQAAADSCERSLKRFPGSANLLCLSAKANIALKNVDIAKSRIEDAMRLFPDFAEAPGSRRRMAFEAEIARTPFRMSALDGSL